MDISTRLVTERTNASEFDKKILPLRKQAEIFNKWLLIRLNTVLPKIMTRENIDCWVVSSREYNEDPLTMTFVKQPEMNAMGRALFIFFLNDDGSLERINVQRRQTKMEDEYYKGVVPPPGDPLDMQWVCAAALIKEKNPKKIGVNYSALFPFGDGMTYMEYKKFIDELDPSLRDRIVSGERVALGWLETRIDEEIDAYRGVAQIAHGIISEAFSSRVVHPGVTTPEDIDWWIRQCMEDMNVSAWFPPNVDIQRNGVKGLGKQDIIKPGDLLWCDFGLKYLGLYTDMQELAYVLRLGEEDAPEGLKDALAEGNRLQDILIGEFKVGRTGNEILLTAVKKAEDKGIRPHIYTHPIGLHGHGAGPTVGYYGEKNKAVPRGEYQLYDRTCHSIELNVKYNVPEWDNQEIDVYLEQDALFLDDKIYFLGGRQTKLHLIE